MITEEARERDGLIQAYLDDILTEPEADRLRTLLRADPAHLDAMIRAVDLEGILVSALGSTSDSPSLERNIEVAPPRGESRSVHHRIRRSSWVSREHAWQIAMAATLLIAVVGFLGFPMSSDHILESGHARLESGREIRRGERLRASESWNLRTAGFASFRLADGSTVEVDPGSALALRPGGGRGLEVQLVAGRANVAVAEERRSLRVSSPGGWVESAGGSFHLRISSERDAGDPVRKGGQPMKGMITAALVTVLAGSASVGNAHGTLSVEPGFAAVLSTTEPPLVVGPAQDAEALLKRLEELSAAVARLEEKVKNLEARNKELKNQANGAGGGPGAVPPGGVPAPGAVPPGGVPAPGAVPEAPRK